MGSIVTKTFERCVLDSLGFEHYPHGDPDMGVVKAFKQAAPSSGKTLLQEYGESTLQCTSSNCAYTSSYPKGTTVEHYVVDGGMLATLFAVHYARGTIIDGVLNRRTL